MNAPLYTVEILRLAADLPAPQPLDRIDGTAERRAPLCGSTVRTDIALDGEGRIVAVSQSVQACAFGQASAALLASAARGRTGGDVAAALESLGQWLGGTSEDPGPWPGLSALGAARSRATRHGAIVLPFETLLAAIEASRR